ncbi:MAG: hypothetical protein ACYDD4_10680, partial [Acidimicrobiales bacterium]
MMQEILAANLAAPGNQWFLEVSASDLRIRLLTGRSRLPARRDARRSPRRNEKPSASALDEAQSCPDDGQDENDGRL